MRRLSALPVSMIAVFLAASGCAGSPRRSAPGSDSGHYASNATFTMALATDPGGFDPYHSQLVLSKTGLAYDSLVYQQPDGKFVSGLANNWSADAHGATFTLRPDLTCSDGTPLTASQVAAAFTYIGDPKNQSPLYGQLIPKIPFTATADDTNRTVKVALRKPFGFLLHTFGEAPIVCEKGLKNPKMLKSASDGTGPFVLTSAVPGQSYTFTVRKNYKWGPNGATTQVPGLPAKVVLKIVTNETTAANLLLSGGLNFAQITGEDRQRATARGLKSAVLHSSSAWLWFNQLGGRPTADKLVRQALASALDTDQLVKVSTGGTGTAATGLITNEPKPCTGNPVSGLLPKHDLAAAGSLLDQAGWTKGSDGVRRKNGKALSFNFHYPPSINTGYKPTAELLSQVWKALGVQIKLTADSSAAFNQAMFQTSNYDIYLVGFVAHLPSQMVPYVSGAVPPKGSNVAGINNSEYSASTAKASTLLPPEACQFWNQAEQALYRDVDVVPISDQAVPYFLQKAQAQISGAHIPIPTSLRVLN